MSPAANTPFTFVAHVSSAITYPFSSVSISSGIHSAFGVLPTAMNTPLTSSVLDSPDLTFFIVIDSTLSWPLISSTTLSVITSILSALKSSSLNTACALNPSRLWIRYTFSQPLDKNSASSNATSPPPTTAVILFLKNAPSHVAQYETPMPVSLSSPSTFNLEGEFPVAIINALASNVPSSVVTVLTSPVTSSEITSVHTFSISNLSACSDILRPKSKPLIDGSPG